MKAKQVAWSAEKAEYQRRRRNECKDFSVPRAGPEKTARIDLGIQLLRAIALPGVEYTAAEIAAWAGCTPSAITLIENKALRKLRDRVLCNRDPALREMVNAFFRGGAS